MMAFQMASTQPSEQFLLAGEDEDLPEEGPRGESGWTGFHRQTCGKHPAVSQLGQISTPEGP